MPDADQTLNQIRNLVEAHFDLDLAVSRAKEFLPFTASQDLNEIEALARYAEATGHRLRINYRNEHGRPTEDRAIVVERVRRGGATSRKYVDAYDREQRSPRTFILDRISYARLDGLKEEA